MRAMRLHQYGEPLRLEEVPAPVGAPGDVVLRVLACGVGLTTVKSTRAAGRFARPLPFVPGHEVVGEVVEVGAEVHHVRPGDRATLYYYLACGQCRFCLRGYDDLCINLRGMVHGGYAEYIAVPGRNAFPLPANLDPVAATAICDAIATPLHVCSGRLRLQPGERVLIMGAGGRVGVHLVQMVRLFGAEALAVDAAEWKLARLAELGATPLPAGPDLPQRVAAATGGAGVEGAVDLVGTADTLSACLASLGMGGRLVNIVGTLDPWPLVPADLLGRELTIAGSRYVSRFELTQAINLVDRGKIRAIVGETLPLEGVNDLHQSILSSRLWGMGAVVPGLG